MIRSPSVEDYIKTIYKLSAEPGSTTPSQLADHLGVSPAAVSKMTRRLGAMRLATHTRGRGITLTRAGTKIALEVIRHHRLLELYLVQAMGYPWDAVHEEAERLEHHISEELEDRIDAMLGSPTHCPHGDPIPTRSGAVGYTSHRSLATQREPERLVVRRVSDEDPGMLRHFEALGVTPGTAIEFLEQEPYGGALLLRVGGRTVRLAPAAARHVFVDPGALAGEC